VNISQGRCSDAFEVWWDIIRNSLFTSKSVDERNLIIGRRVARMQWRLSRTRSVINVVIRARFFVSPVLLLLQLLSLSPEDVFCAR